MPETAQANFVHTATGGSYDDVTATLTATEEDNDRGLVFSNRVLTVPEGGKLTYGIKLSAEPSRQILVGVSRTDGDMDLSLSPAQLGFTTENYNTYQFVTLTATADIDGANGTATIRHVSPDGQGNNFGPIVELVATEVDDDAGLTLSATSLNVSENDSANYTVVLVAKPGGPVTVTIEKSTSGSQDADLNIKGTSSLTFTTVNWNTAQAVTVSADSDDDAAGAAQISSIR